MSYIAAVKDPSTSWDDETLANAVAKLPEYGGTIELHGTEFRLQHPFRINKPGKLRGNGQGVTIITSYHNERAGIVFDYADGARQNIIEDLTVRSAVPTFASGLLFKSATRYPLYRPRVRNVEIQSYWIGVDVFGAVNFGMESGSEVVECPYAGLRIDNIFDGDMGDGYVHNCEFTNVNTINGGDSGILQHASGGLKVTGNKFLGYTVQFKLSLTSNRNTGVLLLADNSFEGHGDGTVHNIYLERQINNRSFHFINIADNELTGARVAAVVTPASLPAEWIQKMHIKDNIVCLFHDNSVGISLGSGRNVQVKGNSYTGIYDLNQTAYQIGVNTNYIHIDAKEPRVGIDNKHVGAPVIWI